MSLRVQDWFKRLPKRHHPDFHWLFLGAAGARTPLHVDPSATHAWLTQISGRKRFRLCAPSRVPELFKQRPPEMTSEALEVTLEPGDTLFVPAQWPHEVECLDDSVSLTWNFLGRALFPQLRAAFLAHCAR